MRRYSIERAWRFFQNALSGGNGSEHDKHAALACAKKLDQLDKEEHERFRAIAHYTEEIERLKRAPEVNECEMRPEWAEMIEIYETAIDLLKEEIDNE